MAGVPLKNENLNFEAFAYAAYHAYDAKMFHMGQPNEGSLLDRLDTCTLAPETRKTILEELPRQFPWQSAGCVRNHCDRHPGRTDHEYGWEFY